MLDYDRYTNLNPVYGTDDLSRTTTAMSENSDQDSFGWLLYTEYIDLATLICRMTVHVAHIVHDIHVHTSLTPGSPS